MNPHLSKAERYVEQIEAKLLDREAPTPGNADVQTLLALAQVHATVGLADAVTDAMQQVAGELR